ncbi:unnamed protein product [Closterium sp. Naga37s-1]|nr:unnamed protein product [Closterium sp. Naga37s-1]
MPMISAAGDTAGSCCSAPIAYCRLLWGGGEAGAAEDAEEAEASAEDEGEDAGNGEGKGGREAANFGAMHGGEACKGGIGGNTGRSGGDTRISRGVHGGSVSRSSPCDLPHATLDDGDEGDNPDDAETSGKSPVAAHESRRDT